MANNVLVVFEKPIYLSFEPVDPHLFATALGVADTPLEISVLLRDSAVTYAVRKQQVSLKILGQEIMEANTSPGNVLSFMLEHGAKIRVVSQHMEIRGIHVDDVIDGVEVIEEREIAQLVREHDSVIVW